jgi:hypothetical protein
LLTGVAAGFTAALFVLFGAFVVFLVDFCLFTGVEVELAVLAEVPAGEAAFGWAANVRGMVATARAIVANSVFFIFFFSLAGLMPAHNSIMSLLPIFLDSLRRLSAAPKSGV